MNATMETTDYRLELSRRLSASPERVFNAWLDPEAMKSWFRPSPRVEVAEVEMTAEVGGDYRIIMLGDEGEQYVTVGKYVEIVPSEKLVFTWRSAAGACADMQPQESRVTILFKPSGTGTELTLTHEMLSSQESVDNHTKGWTGCLDTLVEYAK